MPTICMFRGIKIYINWREHQPPHFHAKYGGEEAFHQEELIENWNLAEKQQELFAIEPLR